jgi:hypothetical protein
MIADLVSRICLRLERVGLAAKKGVLSQSVLGRWIIDFVLLPSDVLKIFRTYRNNLGSFPNIVFPQSFNEKLQRRKLTARHQRYIQWADKISVRDYVSQRLGERYLT